MSALAGGINPMEYAGIDRPMGSPVSSDDRDGQQQGLLGRGRRRWASMVGPKQASWS